MFFKPQVLLKSLRGFDPTSRLPTQNLEPFVQIPGDNGDGVTGSAVKEMFDRGEFWVEWLHPLHEVLSWLRGVSKALCLRQKLKRFSMKLSVDENNPCFKVSAAHHNVEIIDVGKLEEVVAKVGKQKQIHELVRPPCKGIKVDFPEGKIVSESIYPGRGHKLTSSRFYIGIMARIKFGVNENILYLYYGIGNLMAIAKRK
ncbi:hypothetical protein F5888DRAFT_1636616 [Russula emetica]|nr:hypothetical protein F5888DRAFT_1636616 [Russula emetica]